MIKGVPGHDLVTVPERPAPGEAIDEIELEYFAMRVDVQPVEVGAQVAAQDGELGLAVLLDRRVGGSSGCH